MLPKLISALKQNSLTSAQKIIEEDPNWKNLEKKELQNLEIEILQNILIFNPLNNLKKLNYFLRQKKYLSTENFLVEKYLQNSAPLPKNFFEVENLFSALQSNQNKKKLAANLQFPPLKFFAEFLIDEKNLKNLVEYFKTEHLFSLENFFFQIKNKNLQIKLIKKFLAANFFSEKTNFLQLFLFAQSKNFSEKEICEFPNLEIQKILRQRKKILELYQKNKLLRTKKIAPLQHSDVGKKILTEHSKIFSVFEFAKIKKIAEKFENEKFAKKILPENAKNHSTAEIVNFLENFGKKIWEKYGAFILENQCGEISSYFYLLAKSCGIDAHLILGNGDKKGRHVFCVLKIDGREFRIDFTASQYFAGNIGILVTPRLEKENFEFYWREKIYFGFDNQVRLPSLVRILNQIENKK